MHSNFWAGREIARSATHIFPAICRPRHHPVRRYTLASRLPLAAVDSLSDRAGTYSSSACFPSPRDTAFLTEPAAKKSRITTLDIRCSPFHSSIDGLNTSPDSLPSSSPSGASYPPRGLAFGPLEGTPPAHHGPLGLQRPHQPNCGRPRAPLALQQHPAPSRPWRRDRRRSLCCSCNLRHTSPTTTTVRCRIRASLDFFPLAGKSLS